MIYQLAKIPGSYDFLSYNFRICQEKCFECNVQEKQYSFILFLLMNIVNLSSMFPILKTS